MTYRRAAIKLVIKMGFVMFMTKSVSVLLAIAGNFVNQPVMIRGMARIALEYVLV
jgi:hypothetical protein